jgi:succinate dehydrogenase / fumarate reductase flavoprotein subunit
VLADALRDQRAAIESLKARRDDQRQITIRRHMQAVMTEKVGLFREEPALARAVEALADLRVQLRQVTLDNKGDGFNYDLVDALELEGMLDLAEATALGALERTESRGAHWRTDHPGRDDREWLKHSLATHSPDGPPHVGYQGVIITRYQPAERKY